MWLRRILVESAAGVKVCQLAAVALGAARLRGAVATDASDGTDAEHRQQHEADAEHRTVGGGDDARQAELVAEFAHHQAGAQPGDQQTEREYAAHRQSVPGEAASLHDGRRYRSSCLVTLSFRGRPSRRCRCTTRGAPNGRRRLRRASGALGRAPARSGRTPARSPRTSTAPRALRSPWRAARQQVHRAAAVRR